MWYAYVYEYDGLGTIVRGVVTPIMCAVQLGSKKVSADGISALKRESGDEVIDEKLRGTAMDIGDVSLT